MWVCVPCPGWHDFSSELHYGPDGTLLLYDSLHTFSPVGTELQTNMHF